MPDGQLTGSRIAPDRALLHRAMTAAVQIHPMRNQGATGAGHERQGKQAGHS
jgi:hypothetical protein